MATIRNLDHVNLSVRDFSESVDWYARVFGFQLVEDKVTDGVRWGVIRAGDAMLCIYEHPDFTLLDGPARREQKLHGMAHFGLRVEDREDWEQTLRRENVKVNYDGPVRWPHSTSWYINDPTGYEIEVVLWDNNTITFEPL